MTLEELTKHIQSAGLFPIRVKSASVRHDSLDFIGALPEYLQAVKTIGSSVVFIGTITLSEEHFTYQAEMEGDDDVETAQEEEEPIDLCSVLPKLSALKKKIGMTGHFDLSAPMASADFTFVIAEDWFREFIDLRHEAIQLIRERRDAELAEADAAEEEKIERTLKKLHALINDKDFVRLPTQRAMREYALEKVPELDLVEEQELKHELQNLNARIHARGIGRK